MEFRIADSFTDSLDKLTNQEQKAVKTTVFDLQIDPTRPGLSFHKLDRARDPNFASVRVNDDIRLIVHQSASSLLLCYVSHHEDAYHWAERRKIETHPTTGAAQLVEIRERVQEIIVPVYVTVERAKPPLFAKISDQTLLSYGVPLEWLADVRAATEDNILELTDHLPDEAAEALLEVATGKTPVAPAPVSVSNPFDHPDAMRRFRRMSDAEELARALEFPWEKWRVFLPPEQRQIVTADYNGPVRVSGSAGTGKTVVALHRAVHLAQNDSTARILLSTFSDALANALRDKLRTLIYNQPRLGEQIEVHPLNQVAERLYTTNLGKPQVAGAAAVRKMIQNAAASVGEHPFALRFLLSEWEQVVDAWQLDSWEAYRDVPRLGRRTRLKESQRQQLWEIFARVQTELKEKDQITYAALLTRLAGHFHNNPHPPYNAIVLDEAQDVSIPQLKLLAALSGNRPNSLFLAGDMGQRIFQQPFSWKALGVDVRGRSKTLRINYRTSHQIRMQADKLLDPQISDVDGISEARNGTISVFNGPAPAILNCDSPDEEAACVATWLQQRLVEGLKPEEIGVFVRAEAQFPRAQSALDAAQLPYKILDQKVQTAPASASLCTMHLAKGLEFRAVVVMACDDEIIPLSERIQSAADEADRKDAYDTERHLLYVACTRARDHLLITSAANPSEFLEDLVM